MSAMVDQIPVGEQLDLMCARLLGHEYEVVARVRINGTAYLGRFMIPKGMDPENPDAGYTTAFALKRYSKSIADAMELVHWWIEHKHEGVSIMYDKDYGFEDSSGWNVSLGHRGPNIWAATAEEAICRAFLLAMDEEDD